MKAADDPGPRGAPVEELGVKVKARDGFQLAGTLYRCADADGAADVVIFNTGGGLAVQRYRHFLRHLAGQGFVVLGYDYRGVGASRPHRLRGFVAGLEDWAEYDQAGAYDFMHARFRRSRIATVSHSIGCLVACTAPTSRKTSGMVLIGPHTGLWRDYTTAWKWPMALTWHALMPLVARAVGYFPGRRLGLGDDFPLRFARQWAGRTQPAFRSDPGDPRDVRASRLLASAGTLHVPALALSFSDDAFASRAGVARFLASVPRVPVTRREINARADARHGIGHFGFFTRRNEALWATVTDFLHAPPDTDGALAGRSPST